MTFFWITIAEISKKSENLLFSFADLDWDSRISYFFFKPQISESTHFWLNSIDFPRVWSNLKQFRSGKNSFTRPKNFWKYLLERVLPPKKRLKEKYEDFRKKTQIPHTVNPTKFVRQDLKKRPSFSTLISALMNPPEMVIISLGSWPQPWGLKRSS